MAKRVGQLYERYIAVRDELEELMPEQYRRETADSLGLTWRTAVRALWHADDYFMDLVSNLDYRAQRADERAAAMAQAAAQAPPVETVPPIS